MWIEEWVGRMQQQEQITTKGSMMVSMYLSGICMERSCSYWLLRKKGHLIYSLLPGKFWPSWFIPKIPTELSRNHYCIFRTFGILIEIQIPHKWSSNNLTITIPDNAQLRALLIDLSNPPIKICFHIFESKVK